MIGGVIDDAMPDHTPCRVQRDFVPRRELARPVPASDLRPSARRVHSAFDLRYAGSWSFRPPIQHPCSLHTATGIARKEGPEPLDGWSHPTEITTKSPRRFAADFFVIPFAMAAARRIPSAENGNERCVSRRRPDSLSTFTRMRHFDADCFFGFGMAYPFEVRRDAPARGRFAEGEPRIFLALLLLADVDHWPYSPTLHPSRVQCAIAAER